MTGAVNNIKGITMYSYSPNRPTSVVLSSYPFAICILWYVLARSILFKYLDLADRSSN